jgi:hypothetical protein
MTGGRGTTNSTVRRRAVIEKYTVEIDELHDDVVILTVRALRLLVFGRSIEEAMGRARASIDFGRLETDRTPNPSLVLSSQPTRVGLLRRPQCGLLRPRPTVTDPSADHSTNIVSSNLS